MKTLTETITAIIGYEASDGTQFKTKEECEKYEQTAAYVIKERFKKLVIKEIEGCDLTNFGEAFFNAAPDEDWYYALVEIKNEADLQIAMTYAKLIGTSSLKYNFNEDMIGKRVIVAIGEGIYPKPTYGYKCQYNYCVVHGTFETQIEKFKTMLRKFEEVDENGEQATDM